MTHVPIPQRKPDVALNGSNDGGFWSNAGDFLLNAGKQTSQFFVNRELQKLDRKAEIDEAKQLQRLREIENAGSAQRQATFLGFEPSQQKTIVGISSTAAIVMLGAAAFLIATR